MHPRFNSHLQLLLQSRHIPPSQESKNALRLLLTIFSIPGVQPRRYPQQKPALARPSKPSHATVSQTRSLLFSCTGNNASPFVSYLNQQYHGMALALDWQPCSMSLTPFFSMVPLSSSWAEGHQHTGPSRSSMTAPTRQDGLHMASHSMRALTTLTPVLRLENLCFLLAYAILMGYEIYSMDVDNAFLQALLNKEIYVSQAQGFKSKEHPDYICRLIHALYGLKQVQ